MTSELRQLLSFDDDDKPEKQQQQKQQQRQRQQQIATTTTSVSSTRIPADNDNKRQSTVSGVPVISHAAAATASQTVLSTPAHQAHRSVCYDTTRGKIWEKIEIDRKRNYCRPYQLYK